MKKVLSLSFSFVFFLAANSCFAQKNLIPREINRRVDVGDTIVFSFSRYYDGKYVIPTYYKPDTKYEDLDYYMQGYLQKQMLSFQINRRYKMVNYSYHCKFSDRLLGTPIDEVRNKPMVVISTRKFSNKFTHWDHGEYHEAVMENTYFGDTLIYRRKYLDPSVSIPDTVFCLNLDRTLRKALVGKAFYLRINKDLANELDRVLITEYGSESFYREYTVFDCKLFYKGENWLPGDQTFSKPYIILWYQDKFGKITKYSDYETSAAKAEHAYSLQELDALELEWRNKRKEIGSYNFSLIKVDKPRNQNVKKGTLTSNNIFEDNIISIKWDESRQIFNFMLKNMTGNTMKLIWDEALIVNFDGFTERVIHKGADQDALQHSQQPSIIPSLAQLSDYFWSERYYGGKRLVSGYGGSKYNEQNDGKVMKLILPVQVGNIKYTYTFSFEMKWEWKYPELREQ